MKKIIYFFLFLICSINGIAQDSVRVTLCENTNANCFGFESYTRSVQHFNANGFVSEEYNYTFNGCQGALDSVMNHTYDNFYSYDASDRLIVASVYTYNGSDTNELRDTYSYDVNDNITSHLVSAGLVGNLINVVLDTSTYDTSGNIISDIRLSWIDSISAWDTLTINLWAYDSLNRITQTDYYDRPQNTEGHQYYFFDNFSNPIQSVFTTNSGGIFDSSRVIETFDSLNHKTETIRQQWDSLSQTWMFTSRMIYFYDSAGYLSSQYSFGCSDTTCSDTINMSVFSYDAQYRQILQSDSAYISPGQYEWTGYTFINYDAFNNISNEGYWLVQQGCDYSEQTVYTYNSNQQLIHTHHQHYTCDYFFNDCDYFNLNSDSMLVRIYYPFGVCEGDTILPNVTVEGGTPPYTFQWAPTNGIIDPLSSSSPFIADTVITYSLTASDNAGNNLTDTFTLNVNCFITSIDKNDLKTTSLTAFPNPFKELTQITAGNENDEITCEILSVNGKVISRITSSGKVTIHRNNLPAGIYLLRVFTNERYLGTVKILAE